VLAARVLRQMDQLFDASVAYGTSRGARVDGHVVRGKTGTTNDSRDAWFAGWSGGLAAVVWMGNDDFHPTDGAVGGAGPARVFARFMSEAPLAPRGLDAILADAPRPDDPIANLLAQPPSDPLPVSPAPDATPDPSAPDAPDGEAPAETAEDAAGDMPQSSDPIADLLGRLGERP
jgi:penicillin-binding protein 1A